MTPQKTRNYKRPTGFNSSLMRLLILTVTLVLLVLILSGNGAWLVIIAVIIVLTVLILVVGGAPELLSGTLKVVLEGIQRLFHL